MGFEAIDLALTQRDLMLGDDNYILRTSENICNLGSLKLGRWAPTQ